MDGTIRRADDAGEPAGRCWAAAYAAKHRWERLAAFPPGIDPPRKVRVYRRAGTHYLLNWWDPGAKRNLTERVDGDLLAALVRARDIDARVAAVRTAGVGTARRVGHGELVDRFLADLAARAEAGAVAGGTVARYRAALAHYRAYCETPAARKYPRAAAVDRDFRLGFAAFLAARAVTGNGRGGAGGRPMKGVGFVLAAARALFAWAADPDRGGLLPAGFRNPFVGGDRAAPVFRGDPLAAPDVTAPMAADFLTACTSDELLVFAPLALFGLRASEPGFVFREHLTADEFLVPNLPDLEYATKGRRDKRFPLPVAVAPLWDRLRGARPGGLLFVRPGARAGTTPLLGRPLADVVAEYRRRVAAAGAADRAARRAVRDAVLRDAGRLTYDGLEGLFGRVRARVGWPPAATLKDFRHLFATALADAGVPDGYRRYWMGHAPGRDALVAYTHLARMRDHFDRVVAGPLAPVAAAIAGHFQPAGRAG